MNEHEVDSALRYTVRAEVAGAAPRGDAWLRLHARIQQAKAGELPPPVLATTLTAAAPPRWSWVVQTTLLGRFSQLGGAFLLLALLIGDPRSLDRLGTNGRTLEPVRNPAAVVAPAPRAPRPVPAVNRAARLDDLNNDTRTVVLETTAATLLVAGGPDGIVPSPRFASRPADETQVAPRLPGHPTPR
ncbi:MAG TPA: hypothetical protein VM536_21710, partial [Chloroflexia bacterium]|nr:hypothetical protein [Chloroflexia bacterium]